MSEWIIDDFSVKSPAQCPNQISSVWSSSLFDRSDTSIQLKSRGLFTLRHFVAEKLVNSRVWQARDCLTQRDTVSTKARRRHYTEFLLGPVDDDVLLKLSWIKWPARCNGVSTAFHTFQVALFPSTVISRSIEKNRNIFEIYSWWIAYQRKDALSKNIA